MALSEPLRIFSARKSDRLAGELALRRMAQWVNQQMEVYRRDHAVGVRTRPAAETIMVCVNIKPRGPRLVRSARRMAAELHAKWLAVYVQTPRHLTMLEADRDQVNQTLRLAEQLVRNHHFKRRKSDAGNSGLRTKSQRNQNYRRQTRSISMEGMGLWYVRGGRTGQKQRRD